MFKYGRACSVKKEKKYIQGDAEKDEEAKRHRKPVDNRKLKKNTSSDSQK